MAQLEDGAFVLDRILERVESAELPTAAGARGNDQNTDSIQMSALLLSKLLVSETVQQTAGDRTWDLRLFLFDDLSTILEVAALAAMTKGGMQMARDPMKDALDYAERKPGTAYGHAAREDDAFNKSTSRNARAAKRVSTPSAKRTKPPSGFMRSVGRLIVGIVIFFIVISILNAT